MHYSLIFFLWLLSIMAAAQEGYRVRSVKMKGNKEFYSISLQEVVKTKGTNIVNRWILKKEPFTYFSEDIPIEEQNLLNFYQKQGFLSFKVDSVGVQTNHKRENVKITFFLTEGEPYQFGKTTFAVNETRKPSDYFKGQSLKTKMYDLQTQEGNRFSDEAVYADETVIKNWFAEEGYPYAQVNKEVTLVPDSLKAHIRWKITTGPLSYIGPIKVSGMVKIKEESIQKNVSIKEGTVFNRRELENTQKRIVDMGVFNIATITPVLAPSQPDTVPIRIQVGEAPRITTRFGVGYGKEERFRAFVKLQKIGVFGGTRRLELQAKTSYLEPYNLSLKFIQPGFIRPLTFVFYPYTIKQNEPGYELSKYGGSLTLYKSFTRSFSSSLSYKLEEVNLDTTSVADISQEEITSDYSKAGFTLAAIYDNTWPIFDPNKGFTINVTSQINGLIKSQEYPFTKFSAEYKHFTVPYGKTVLAGKIMMGTIYLIEGGTTVPVEERFYSGGVGSVRGWNRQELGPLDENGIPKGGNSIFEGSVEMRFPLINPLKLITFFDFGNVWEQSGYINPAQFRYSAGGGFRVSSPIGPIGFDVARPIFEESRNWIFMINIGPSF